MREDSGSNGSHLHERHVMTMAKRKNLTIAEAAEYAGLSTAQVYRAVRSVPPPLRGRQDDPGATWYVMAGDVDEWVRSMDTRSGLASTSARRRKGAL